jgi:ferredoxin-NADP reductase
MGDTRGRVVRIRRETADAVTVVIQPQTPWQGHSPGQYLRLGVELEGTCHWRAYSLTSAPGRQDGCISVTPRRVEGGRVSPYLCDGLSPGATVRLGGVEGGFTLPRRPPKRALFITAGSGITPVMSMLRTLAAARRLTDVVHIHCERLATRAMFAAELRVFAAAHSGYRLYSRATATDGRLNGAELDRLCADWRRRETFVSAPAGLRESIEARFRADGDPRRLHTESFQAGGHGRGAKRGRGGTIHLRNSGVQASSDGSEAILQAAEQAGVQIPHGCRLGICRSCVCRLRAGRVRDLRTGRVHGHPGEYLRACINAPEGAIELDL